MQVTTPKQTKPWGETRCVHRDQTHEIWHATINKGGFSSRHSHERKVNLFYVVTGTLRVHVFHSPISTIPSSTFELKRGEQITVEDGTWHQFEAVTDVELCEVYWVYLKGEDINRADEGGMK